MASSFKSAPATNWPGLPLLKQQPTQVGPLCELADQARQLLQDLLRQRVDLLVGQVESDESDLAVELVESEMRSP